MKKKEKIDTTGKILILSLFICLAITGYLSYRSIDYKILDKLENQKLILPTPIPSPKSK